MPRQTEPNANNAAVALRYPQHIDEAQDLLAALSYTRPTHCLFTEDARGKSRFPGSCWMEGPLEDLSDMVRLVSVPQGAVEETATKLQEGIDVRGEGYTFIHKPPNRFHTNLW